MEISIKCGCGINNSISHYDKDKGVISTITVFCNCDKIYSSDHNLKNKYKLIEALECEVK